MSAKNDHLVEMVDRFNSFYKIIHTTLVQGPSNLYAPSTVNQSKYLHTVCMGSNTTHDHWNYKVYGTTFNMTYPHRMYNNKSNLLLLISI